MTMSPSHNVPQFLESWQSTLQEVAIPRCTFSEPQKVNLLLGTLPSTWSAFITIQGGLLDLTFTN